MGHRSEGGSTHEGGATPSPPVPAPSSAPRDASAWLVYTTDKAQQTNSRFWEAPWEGWNPGPAVTLFD
jgi:hypothetical protein